MDKAILKGCEAPMELYTVDIDLFQGEMPILNVAGMQNHNEFLRMDSIHSTAQQHSNK